MGGLTSGTRSGRTASSWFGGKGFWRRTDKASGRPSGRLWERCVAAAVSRKKSVSCCSGWIRRGTVFSEETRTVTLSRHGAGIISNTNWRTDGLLIMRFSGRDNRDGDSAGRAVR